MLLMVGKGIRGGIYQSIYQYAKDSNKYMKDYDKSKESPYIQYWDEKNYMDGKNFQQIFLSESKILFNLTKIS